MDADEPDEMSGIQIQMEGVLVVEDSRSRPSVIVYHGQRYTRFHDFIYTSSPLDELTPEQVLAVCELRSKLSTRTQFKQNERVREIFNLLIPAYQPNSVLEIGPGARPLFPAQIDDFRYELADLDPNVVKQLVASGYAATLFTEDVPLQQKDNSVDLLFAIFVFQFPIGANQAKEFLRVLGPSGLILANVYRRPAESRDKLRTSFASRGCQVEVIALDDGIGHDHEYWLIGPDLSNRKCASVIALLRRCR